MCVCVCVCVCMCVCVCVCWAAEIEGDPEAPFPIATTSTYRKGRYYFPWVAPLTLDLYLIMLSIV